MRRAIALLLLFSGAAFAADKLPNPEPGSFDIEPPLLIPNRDREKNASAATSPAREVDLAKLDKEFERANRNIAGLDKLLKIGAL